MVIGSVPKCYCSELWFDFLFQMAIMRLLELIFGMRDVGCGEANRGTISKIESYGK
jgi:hypothetical protein